VWVVTIRGLKRPPPDTRTDQAKVALIGQLRLAGWWHAGAVVLRLYTRGGQAAKPHGTLPWTAAAPGDGEP
jgi:hypothetical protein